MPASAATGRPGAADLPAVCAPLFTGRGREQAALAAVLDGPPAVVLVEGEAGIGKTRLLREYLAGAQFGERGALVATCPPLARPQTLAPVAEAIRQAAPDEVRALRLSGLAGALRPLFPEWADRLPPAPEPAEDASAARYRVFAALRELIERLGAGLLVVEDAHWADEVTLEFVLYLATTAPRPVGLVVTCRPEDVPAGSLLPRIGRLASGPAGLRLSLGPLGVGETAGMVGSMLAGAEVSGEFAAFLHGRTEGVPLAVEELVRLLVGRDDLAHPGGQWIRRPLDELQVPATIRDAVLERAGRLDTDARTVLQAAAALAEPAGYATLAAAAGLSAERLTAGLSQALACGLLEEDGGGLISFRHALAARTVYEAIPGPNRRILHERAGTALESQSPPPLAALTRHFREAGDMPRWVRYGEQAADLAQASGDEATANKLLCDILTGAQLQAAEMARLTRKIPGTSFTGPAPIQSLLEVLRDVLNSEHLDPSEDACLRFQVARLLTVMEEYDMSAAELERAVRHLPAGSPDATRAMILLGWPGGNSLPASKHLAWLRRAAGAPPPADPAERLGLAVDRASALLRLGVPEGWTEATRLPGDAPTVAERRQLARGYLNIGNLAMLWGRYGEARQHLAGARQLAERGRYVRTRGNISVTQTHLDYLTGSWVGLAERVAALADREDLQPVTQMEAILVTALLGSATGAQARAEEHLRLICEETRRRDAMEVVPESAAALAMLALAEDRIDDALQVTCEPMRIVTCKGTWIWATDLGPARTSALAAAGRAEEAADVVAAFARGLRGRDAPGPMAGLVLCRAILAEARREHACAARLFARAAVGWQALPRPYDALLARERQARCLLAAGSPEAGLELLAEVRGRLAALGAKGDAARIALTLREHGVAAPRVSGGGRPGYGGRLSPRELEVARLAAAGRTNREIAQELCRSPNTVGTQLTSAMRKLNVSSRTALATRLAPASPAAAGVLNGHPDHSPLSP
jgi:DNA-binding CsgD family transcriptional regulator